MAIKVTILDSGDLSHDETVRDNVIIGAGGALEGSEIIIQQHQDISDVVEDINSGLYPDLEMVIGVSSTDNVAGIGLGAKSIYPKVQCIAAIGANLFVNLSTPYDYLMPTIGIGSSKPTDDETKNYAAYNANLEFYDKFVVPEESYVACSFAAGFFAGKLWAARNNARSDWGYTDFSWWETRYLFRFFAKRLEDNRETTLWDARNGFGRALQLTEEEFGAVFNPAVKFNRDEIPADPFLKGDIGVIEAINANGSVQLVLDAVSNASIYKIYRDETLIYTGSDLTFNDTIEKQVDDYSYTYIALDRYGNYTDYSDAAIVTYSPDLIATLAEVKKILNITDTDSDSKIKGMLIEVDSFIKSNINNDYTDEAPENGLKFAFAQFIKYNLDKKQDGLTSLRVGSWSESYTDNIPNSIMNLLTPYRRMGVIK